MRTPAPGFSEKIEAAAAAWLARRDAGFSGTDAAEFAAWCAAHPDHRRALAAFEQVWTAVDRPGEPGLADVIRAGAAARRRRRARRRATLSGGVAAGFALLLTAALWRAPEPADRSVPRAAVHVPERQVLPDGSVAEYPAGVRLTVAFESGVRRVTLVGGEAHFQVAKDPARPFVVSAGRVDVRAVGTGFVVRLGEASTDVVVTEGVVAVERSGPADAAPQVARLAAGDSVAVRGTAADPVATFAPLSAAETAARLAWRQRRVEFSSATLAEVIAAVNRAGAGPFALAEPALAEMTVSGVFRLGDADELAGLLARSLDLEARRDARGQIVFRRAP